MDQKKQISSGDSLCCDRLDSLSSKYSWFIVQNSQDDIDDEILSSLHNPLFKYNCRIPELIGKRIRGCFHGWMILSDNAHNMMWSLWNPSTSDIIYLPPLFLKDGDYDSIRDCCLSAPPDDPNSVLLFTRTNKPTFVFCQLNCKRNKKLRNKPRWTEMSYAHQLKRITWAGKLVYNLTYCNGNIYALNSDCEINVFVIRVEIVVKDKEVLVKLVLFGSAPSDIKTVFNYFHKMVFLKGSDTELYCIIVGYHHDQANMKKIPDGVELFKLDTTSIKWDELKHLKKWDISDMVLDEVEPGDLDDSGITEKMWEEIHDLKDASFYVDLARNNSIFYSPAINSEVEGIIHIRDKMEKVIYSYDVYYKTIVPSHMHPSVLPTSHVSVLECRFEGAHRETIYSKQEEDEVAVTLVTDDDEVEVSESVMFDIPFDVFQRIMRFCVGVEYMNFRATCKRCQLAAPVIQWRNDTSLRRLQNYSVLSPWLMVVEKKRGIITFTDPLLGDKYFMKNPLLSFDDDRHYCCRFGWFLFKTKDLGIAFFNPFTNDLRELPSPGCCLQSLCFSAPPTCRDCMVVGFTHEDVFIHFVAGKPTWRRLSLGDPKDICFPTFYEGDLYALCNKGKIVVFKDLSKKDYSYKVFETEPLKSCHGSLAQYFFCKCDEHLLLVIVAELGEPIEVFKLSDSKREWEKINGIGKHMIYISDTTCLCIEAKLQEMENKIYLPQLCPTSGKVVFYSLDTCTFHTFNGKSIQEKLGDTFTTTHLSAQAWIEPSWSGLVREEEE